MPKAILQQKSPSLNLLAETCVEAAQRSGAVLMKYFNKKLKIGEKEGAGLVTNADLESERAAVRLLKSRFPQFGFLTEESRPVEVAYPGRFILDPLDGTTNFVHGFPMFCVSLAAEWQGKVVVGVIYHPILKDTYLAIRGKGAFLNGKRLRVSATRKLEQSLLTTGFTYRKDVLLHAEMQTFEQLSGVARAIRRPGSAALDLAYTARGVFDGFWERRLSPWDVAAGSLLVTEAGGRVSDFSGDAFQVDAAEILASNRRLHPALLKMIAPKISQI